MNGMKRFSICMGLGLCFVFPLCAQSALEWAERAGRAFNARNFEEAKRDYRIVAALDTSKKGWVYSQLAAIFVQQSMVDSAIASYHLALSANYFPYETELRLAAILSKAGRFAESVEILQVAVREKPKDVRAYLALFDTYLRAGDAANARKVYEASASVLPDSAVLMGIKLDLREKNVASIANNIERIAKLDLVTFEEFPGLLDLLRQNRNWKEAEKLLKTMEPKSSRPSEVRAHLLQFYGQDGTIVSAEEALPSGTVVTPLLENAAINLSRSYVSSNLFRQAEELLLRVLRLNSGCKTARLELIAFYNMRGLIQKGVELVDRFDYYYSGEEAMPPEWDFTAAILFARNRDLPHAGRFAKYARNKYDAMIRSNPDRVDLILKVSVSLLLSDDLAQADAQLQKYLQQSKGTGETIAAKTLKELINDGVVVQDANYLLNKYTLGDGESSKSVSGPGANRDAAPPGLSILSPVPAANGKIETDKYSIEVDGISSDNEGVSIVYIAGTVAQITTPTNEEILQSKLSGKTVKYSGDAMLSLGKNIVEVRAVDVNGNVTKQMITVYRTQSALTGRNTVALKEQPAVVTVRDTAVPRLSILSPVTARGKKIETDKYSIEVRGYSSDNEGISVVYVGGTVAQLTVPTKEELAQAKITGKALKYDAEAMLTLGENSIEVRAVDVNGNVAKQTIKVYRYVTTVAGNRLQGSAATVKLPNIWAVVVGISEYQNKDLALSYADKDAQAFFNFLKSPSGGAVTDERIELLTNRNAQRSDIIRALNEKLRMAFEDDEVIIFFACHGIPDEVSSEVYFLGYDADIRNVAGTGISQTDVQKAIATARAKKVLLIADACHSGGISVAPNFAQRGMYASTTNKLLLGLAQARDGIAMLTASSASEFSQEGKTWGGHGVFTNYLVSGLGGPADYNNDGTVTIREIFEFVYRKVADDTGGKQHPDLQGKFDNTLPVSVVR